MELYGFGLMERRYGKCPGRGETCLFCEFVTWVWCLASVGFECNWYIHQYQMAGAQGCGSNCEGVFPQMRSYPQPSIRIGHRVILKRVVVVVGRVEMWMRRLPTLRAGKREQFRQLFTKLSTIHPRSETASQRSEGKNGWFSTFPRLSTARWRDSGGD